MNLLKDKILLALGVLIVVAGGGYYFYQSQLPTAQELSDKTVDSIATLTIKNENLDPDTAEKFREQFNALRTKFLQDQSIQNFFTINAMGRLKQDVGDFEGAEEAFLFAYDLDPGGYVINGNLANLYQYGLKNYEKAEKFYLDTLAIDNIQEGNHYTYFAELYELYFYRLNDQAKAEALLERAMEELPENARILILAASHYQEIGATQKARELYSKILEFDPNNTAALNALESL